MAREYLREHGQRSVAQTVDLLAENLADYRALVHRCTDGELPVLLMRLLAARGSRSVVVPPGLPPHWLAAVDATRVHDRAASTPQELDGVDSVVTGCAVAVAETGTIVLDGSPTRGGGASPWSPTTTSASCGCPTRSCRRCPGRSSASTRPAR